MRLRTNIAWMLFGNGSFAAFQWLYLICVTRFLGIPEAGLYALCQAIIFPTFSLCNLQLRRLQVTDRNNAIPFGDYLVFAILSSCLAFAIGWQIFTFSSERAGDAQLLFIVLACAKFVETLTDACYGNMQHREHMRPVATSLLLRNSVGFAAFAALLSSGLPLWQVATAIPAAWLVVLLVHDLRHVATTGPRLRVSQATLSNQWLIIRVGLPLGALIFLNQLYLSTPRLALDHFWGLAALGQFAPLASLMTLGSLVMNAVNSAALPRLSKMHHDRNAEGFMSLSLKLLGIAVVVGCAGILVSVMFSEFVVQLIFGKAIADAGQVFLLVMIASAFWYMATAAGTSLTAVREFKGQMYISTLMLIVCAGVCVVAVPAHGIHAAALALIAGSVVKFSIQTVLMICSAQRIH